jgi:hypothetical protein
MSHGAASSPSTAAASARPRRVGPHPPALVLALLLVLAACAGRTVAATVGGTEITVAQIEQAYSERTEASEVARTLERSEGGAVEDELRREVLTNLIRREILRLAAEDQAIDVTEEDLADERAALVERLGGREELDELLAVNNVSDDQLRSELRDQAIQTRLGEQLRADVTHSDVRAAFEDGIAQGAGQRFTDVEDAIRAQLEEDAARQAVGAYLADFVDDLGVEVDQRYGRWDEGSIAVVPTSRPETPELPARPPQRSTSPQAPTG